jgi:hypothetical protein
MKKLKLGKLNLSNAEVLTREQLKKVLGGDGSGGGSGTSWYCWNEFTDFQGIIHSNSGLCGSQDRDTCQDYVMNNCRSEASAAGGTCLLATCS